MKLELHIIQNFAPACLNRDDVNAPKDCEFGGYRRARISSQCLKRAIRVYWDQRGLLNGNRAKRTRLIVDHVAQKVSELGRPLDEAKDLVEFALAQCDLATRNGKSEYLLFVGDQAIAALAGAVAGHWDALAAGRAAQDEDPEGRAGKKGKKGEATATVPPEVRRALEVLFDGTAAADIALFGRMIADKPAENVDAACQVAHAISTHQVSMEMDYYTAVDDLQPHEDTGAGMLGYTEFNSACYYRYSLVDYQQLVRNLGGDAELAAETIRAYLTAAVNSIPSGKQNTTAAHNPPTFVLAVVRDGGAPWSLANAFERPVRPGPREEDGLVRRSIERLDGYWGKLTRAYGDQGVKALATLCLEDASLANLGATVVQSLVELIDRVEGALGR